MDRAKGHFTQEDPIGLAGGMDLYGFASGDPVNFSDQFGLTPDWLDDLKRAGRRKIIEIGIRIWAGTLGEEIKKIEPEPTPVVAPAPGKDGKKKDDKKTPGSSPDPKPDPMERIRKWLPTLPTFDPTRMPLPPVVVPCGFGLCPVPFVPE